MARTGVTEEQVHAAADALTLRGERPTIERVRAELGTGSPNTLIRHLDTWWSQLGGRLNEQLVQVTIPDAPPSVALAASAVWRAALEQAEELAQRTLQTEQQQLAQARAAISSEAEAAVQQTRTAGRERDEALGRAAAAEQRARDLEQLIGELTAQRDRLSADHAGLAAEQGLLADRLREANDAMVRLAADTVERVQDIESRARMAENRWLAEVDRARQELRSGEARLQQELKSARASLDEARRELATAQHAAAGAMRANQASEVGRQALEAEVARLHTALLQRHGAETKTAKRQAADMDGAPAPRRSAAPAKKGSPKGGAPARHWKPR